ncbi:MAG TPA: ABC transporter ATP-binding protein [Ktedonobacteraceae bacterium]|jgi:peptide/nickel transport system ATP-binding protein|nr:ABC transporter ATP-binding protein [Ktedonobacteraceae bacterium]
MTQFAASDRQSVLLDVQHASVVYDSAGGEVYAVNDVSFTLRRGEILGLAGESGSGKSTLAYAIARLLRPPARVTGGRILYYPRPRGREAEGFSPSGSSAGMFVGGESIDVLALDRKELRAFRWSELAMVFQSAMNALNPVATIEAQIADVLRVHRPQMSKDQRRARAIELLKLVGIAPERLKSYPHELSGGMRQRAVIAIALALSPEIIIMDEPTTALDVVIQRDILTEVMRLRQQLGFAVIFITHDLSLLLEVADEVIIMYAGRIVEKASREALYRLPLHPYTNGLLHSFPTLDGPLVRMSGIPGTPPDLRELPPGCVFAPRCGQAWDLCFRARPALGNPPGGKDIDERLVACHLYDSQQGYRSPRPETALRGQGDEV